MDAPLTEVAVQRGLIAESPQEATQVLEVSGQLGGMHRRVLPPRPGVRHARDEGGGPQARFTDLPHRMLLPGVLVDLDGWRMRLRFEALLHLLRPGVGLL